MNEELFLLDNNALSHLTLSQRASLFFRMRCFLPTEIIHEADGFPDAAAFKDIEYPTTGSVLKHLGTVMAAIPAGDTNLVNLYANKGAGDPMLIACALDGMEKAAPLLWGPTWVVISNDKAVRAVSTELGVEARSRDEFFRRTVDEWRSPDSFDG
ncbi:hypothetical protein [Herbiconiux sp. A18JL235]|uniref:PIN domain-containing protein n=1 Tax=Herbiconiux sp. A18JL235 TaxID=3152363 RepID=A0AB39BFH5_9MICO